MIPPKLYIPTSSLNFNNIMSSESISPSSFYVHRRFGYDRFYKVAANELDNNILLYEKYPVFFVDDSKLENYPIVFEIDARTVNVELQRFQDVYLSRQTIYLTPFNTRIIFRNIEERQIIINKAFPMIDTKLIPLYQGQFVVLSSDIETFDWQPISIDDLPDYDSSAVSFDIKLNKLKGMLYGYLLGANESSTQEVVLLKQKVKNLRNVLSAIIASPDGCATHFQEQQLTELYTEINQHFYALSDVQARIKEIEDQKIVHYNVPNFVEVLKGEGFYDEWYQKQISKYNLRYHQIRPFYSHGTTSKVAELDKYIDDIENAILVYDVRTKLDVSKMPIVQNRHIVAVPEQKEFLTTLLNEYLKEVWNGAEFLSSRYDFARFGGKLFRELLGANWENSSARVYINSLLKNLNEYSEFDINSTDSLILKSFAAFCQKGESDIDKLRDYLISNGIGDFRIALALWGLIFGFAEMPKTLTNDLFESQDGQYVSICYKFIHKQLHTIELEGDLDRTIKKCEKHSGVWNGIKNIGTKVKEIFTSEPEKEIVPSGLNDAYIPKELEIVFNSEAFKKLSPQAQQFFKTESLNLYTGNKDKTYIEALKKLEYPKSKTNWQRALKALTQGYEKTTKRCCVHQKPLSLFTTISTGEFLNDYDFLQCNDEFRLLVSAIKGWEKDLKWFIDAHNSNHKDYKYYEGKPTDNESVIKQFIFLKNEKYKNTESFLRKTYLS